MKPVTREIGAGIVPARMLEDGQLPSAAFVMFSALTLYAEPDGDWDEWELDFGNRGGMSAGTKAVCGNKAMMDRLVTGGYIEELVWDGEVALFSFPDWVKEMLRGGSNAECGIGETRPEAKAEEETGEDAGGGEDEAEEQEVRRSAPAAYAEKKAYKDAKCKGCGRKIVAKEKYYARPYAGAPKFHEQCVPEEEEESKAPLTPDPSPPRGEGRKEELVAQSGGGESTCASSAFPIETGYVVAGGPGEVKAIFREALEEYEAEKRDIVSVEEIQERAAAQLAAEQSLYDRIAESIDKLLAEQYTRHEGGTTVAELEELVRDQDLIETALGVEITRRLDGDGFLSGSALRIIDTTARTVGEFLAERGICFTRRKEMITEWFPASAGMTDGDGGEGRKEAAEGQG